MKQGSDIKKNKRKELFCLIDDDSAFVPVENIRIIELVINNIEEAKQLLKRIRIMNNE